MTDYNNLYYQRATAGPAVLIEEARTRIGVRMQNHMAFKATQLHTLDPERLARIASDVYDLAQEISSHALALKTAAEAEMQRAETPTQEEND
ncbi:hypothetical protein [Canibacter oris]|uniref:Uncharacterized protein n=1 Tax=Canibacter oris TaxID=1365628 RepID=A0A840DPX2_9MICO|nr:hypothetical protein [Canibacter oris]MBB4071599.1 hypothetical protein [Canibacter oris]